jgi:hypothetical protein
MRAPSYDDLSLELGSSGPDPVLGFEPGDGGELEIDEPPRPAEDPRWRHAGPLRHGNFTGADLAESLLETEPTHEEALRYADGCRSVDPDVQRPGSGRWTK